MRYDDLFYGYSERNEYDRELEKERRLLDDLMSAIYDDAFPPDPKQAKRMHWSEVGVLSHIFEYNSRMGDIIDDADDQGYTPLTYACSIGTPYTVSELKHGGADFSAPDGRGRTALIAAAMNKNKQRSVDVIEYLLKIKVQKKQRTGGSWSLTSNRDYEGNTALIYAAGLGNLEVARILIDKKDASDLTDCVNIVNMKGETALSMALFNSHHDVAKFLLSAGAKATGVGGAYALLYSLYKGNEEITEALLDSRKDWGRAKEDEILLMMVAADEHGHLLIGKLMERVLACVEGDDAAAGASSDSASGGSAVRDENEVVCLNDVAVDQ